MHQGGKGRCGGKITGFRETRLKHPLDCIGKVGREVVSQASLGQSMDKLACIDLLTRALQE